MNPAEPANNVVALSQRVDALAQTVHTLQLENQTLQELVAQNPNVPRFPPETNVNPPAPFTGDRETYGEFISACKLVFELCPCTFPNDRIKVLTLISYLRGEPRAWANTYLEK